MANNPVNISSDCVLERTQEDPDSSIRACLCTKDFCNGDIPSSKKGNWKFRLFNNNKGFKTNRLTDLTIDSWLYCHFLETFLNLFYPTWHIQKLNTIRHSCDQISINFDNTHRFSATFRSTGATTESTKQTTEQPTVSVSPVFIRWSSSTATQTAAKRCWQLGDSDGSDSIACVAFFAL